MRKLFSDEFTLENLNKQILMEIQNQTVNHIQMVAASDDNKISVVLSSNGTNGYHGLHPSFSDEYLIEFLTNLPSISTSDFWMYIEKEQKKEKWFNLSKKVTTEYNEDELTELEIYLFARCILTMASKFGFRFYLNDINKEELENILEQTFLSEELSKQTFYQFGKNKNGEYVELLGLLPEYCVQSLSKNYRVVSNNEDLTLHLTQSTGIAIEEILSFKHEEILRRNFRLRLNEVYYSGVMPRVTSIEYDDNRTQTSDIKHIIFHVERTTFATLDMMDKPRIIWHPFFNFEKGGRRIRDVLFAFDQVEDRAQEILFEPSRNKTFSSQKSYELDQIQKINDYLKHSFNSHTVAVSGNIETKDGYLLMGKRSLGSIDANEYYCSVNGQSEFIDKHVDFYNKSVYEDLPTMQYDIDYRVDIEKELYREAVAELGVSLFQKEWDYYGFSYLAINNTGKAVDEIEQRRMHFNILAYNESYQDFDEIVKNHGNTTESFENEKIAGMRTFLYDDKLDLVKQVFTLIINYVYEYFTVIAVLTIFLFSLINFLFGKQNTEFSIVDVIETIVVVIYFNIFIFSKNKDNQFKHLKYTVLINESEVSNKKSNELIQRLVSKTKQKADNKFHAIMVLMNALYFMQKSGED